MMLEPLTVKEWARYQWVTSILPNVSGRVTDEAEVVRSNVNWLIQNLYDPHPDLGSRASVRVVDLGLDDEPINWGDLSAVDVEPCEEGWRVLIEEASPDCVRFPQYIAEWMRRWGWAVTVETEW